MNRLKNLSVPATHSLITAVIDHGCEFEGKLSFRGTVRIGGVFRGEIFTPDTLIISPGASVNANVEAGIIIISGEVNGVLQAKHRIEMHKPAVFQGKILTPSLSVEVGVIFNGNSKMTRSLEIPVDEKFIEQKN